MSVAAESAWVCSPQWRHFFAGIAVAAVGANIAGFSIPLMPAFGAILAMVFLGEKLHLFHLIGIATIFIGVILSARPAAAR